MRGMVVGKGGRSSGVLLYNRDLLFQFSPDDSTFKKAHPIMGIAVTVLVIINVRIHDSYSSLERYIHRVNVHRLMYCICLILIK